MSCTAQKKSSEERKKDKEVTKSQQQQSKKSKMGKNYELIKMNAVPVDKPSSFCGQ